MATKVELPVSKELAAQLKLCEQRTFSELMGIISEGVKPDDLVEAICSCLPPAKQNSISVKAALITLLKKMGK